MDAAIGAVQGTRQGGDRRLGARADMAQQAQALGRDQGQEGIQALEGEDTVLGLVAGLGATPGGEEGGAIIRGGAADLDPLGAGHGGGPFPVRAGRHATARHRPENPPPAGQAW